MRVLKIFATAAAVDEDGNPVLDDNSEPTVATVELEFEDGSKLSFRPPSDEDDADGWDGLEQAATNVLVDEDVVVDEDDRPWLDWFAESIRIVPAEAEVSGELGTTGIELGTELGTTSEELGGGTFEPETGARASGKVVRKENPSMRGKGPGCKHPTQVSGWALGRVLTVSKTHRGKGWGRCFYHVTCVEGGGYKLTQFKGNRTDLVIGEVWSNVSEMFRVLMGDNRLDTSKQGRRTQDAGKWQQGHRMTIKRWFNLTKN
jgi:hypothetical protein